MNKDEIVKICNIVKKCMCEQFENNEPLFNTNGLPIGFIDSDKVMQKVLKGMHMYMNEETEKGKNRMIEERLKKNDMRIKDFLGNTNKKETDEKFICAIDGKVCKQKNQDCKNCEKAKK